MFNLETNMELTSPRYRINAVSQLTGVPTATLRAWERRYGFPTPGRSSSAYRLYSERDVELVKRMRELIDGGVAPNEAAKQLLAGADAAPPDVLEPGSDPYGLAVERIVDAAAKFDHAALNAEIRRALMLDSGVTAFERVLRPSLVAIGDRWHAGEISIASEHFASHLITSATLDLLRLVSVPQDAPTVVLACFSEEQHVLPLYGAALELASWGYRPLIVGARTPPTAIARAREALDPDLIGLSVTLIPEPASTARDLVDAYADAALHVPLLVGGKGAVALAPFIEARGGHVAHAEAEARRRQLDQLVTRSASPNAPEEKTGPPARRGRKPVH